MKMIGRVGNTSQKKIGDKVQLVGDDLYFVTNVHSPFQKV
ncbi:MAG: hypothetical protein CM15mP59_5000 [Flavobacteriaceae bacterium]|nr:MAG: hypothetical protein CM15mP59_5000 [Flavobacteriaceae bacterium]